MPLYFESTGLPSGLSALRAGQRDVRRRQADDDFEGWVKTTVLY